MTTTDKGMESLTTGEGALPRQPTAGEVLDGFMLAFAMTVDGTSEAARPFVTAMFDKLTTIAGFYTAKILSGEIKGIEEGLAEHGRAIDYETGKLVPIQTATTVLGDQPDETFVLPGSAA